MLNMRDIARSGHVTRWHSVLSTRGQTISDHHYMVTMIAREISKRMLPDMSAEDRLLLLEYCLLHDASELLTGDVASPLKKRLQSMLPDNIDLFNALDAEICPELVSLRARMSESPLKAIAKLADFIDGIVFINIEGIGSHARAVADRLLSEFHLYRETAAKWHPDLDWTIADGVLDEMLNGKDNQLAFEHVR